MILLGKPHFDSRESRAVAEVFKTGWVGRGKQVEEFEKEFAAHTGAQYAIAVNSCTVGLFLSLKYLGVKPGDEVIVPSMTWNATAAVVVHLGAHPVFADIKPNTWCLDPDDVKRKITRKTKAIIPVHYAGQFAKGFEQFDIPIVYDSAHRISQNDFIGATTVHSFYVTKNITTVRGGMILTNDAKEAAWLRMMRTSGIQKDVLKRYRDGDFRYEVEHPSWNFDMSDIEAAIGRVQLSKIHEFNKKREYIVAEYNKAFTYNNEGNHLYPITVANRIEFFSTMKTESIQCGVHYFPLHQMKGYAKYLQNSLPVTEFFGAHNVSLPLYTAMTLKDVKKVAETTKRHAQLVTYQEVTREQKTPARQRQTAEAAYSFKALLGNVPRTHERIPAFKNLGAIKKFDIEKKNPFTVTRNNSSQTATHTVDSPTPSPRFPARAGSYQLINSSFISQNASFPIGLYKDKAGREFVAKQWNTLLPKKNRNRILKEYRVHKNMIATSKVSDLAFSAHSFELCVPRLRAKIESDNHITLLFDKVTGTPLTDVPTHRAVKIYAALMKYLLTLTDVIIQNRKGIKKRSTRFIILSFFFILIKSLLRHPGSSLKLLKGAVLFIEAIPSLLRDNKYAFVHRDLNPNNILVNKNKLYLIDFESAVLAHPYLEITNALIRLWGTPSLRTAFFKGSHLRDILNTPKTARIYRAFGMYTAVFDLATKNSDEYKAAEEFFNHILHLNVARGDVSAAQLIPESGSIS